MRVQTIIFISLFASLNMDCSQPNKDESGKIEVKEVTFVDIHDDIPPPPENLTLKFKTMKEWLSNLCDDKKPEKTIATYEFGLFESPDEFTIVLVGLNKYDKDDTSYTRIEYEPSNMYFQIPESEHKNLHRTQLLDNLTTHLKEFINSEKFKTSFFKNADSIVFATTGQTIWSKHK